MKERLVDDTKDLARGAVLRCKGRTDRENLADLMVVLWRADEGHGHALVSVSGRDAGRLFALLPPDSVPPDGGSLLLSKKWLECNWSIWGHPGYPIDAVELIPEPPQSSGTAVPIKSYGQDLVCGDIIRCRAKWPYEDSVDFMVVQTSSEGPRRYAQLVFSGYKAGHIVTEFPAESRAVTIAGDGLSWVWLERNWMIWGYDGCPWEDVLLIPKQRDSVTHAGE
jgi:hypothetical protein